MSSAVRILFQRESLSLIDDSLGQMYSRRGEERAKNISANRIIKHREKVIGDSLTEGCF